MNLTVANQLLLSFTVRYHYLYRTMLGNSEMIQPTETWRKDHLDVVCPHCGCIIRVKVDDLDREIENADFSASNVKSCNLQRVVNNICKRLESSNKELQKEFKSIKSHLLHCGSRPCSRRYLGLESDLEYIFHEMVSNEAQQAFSKYQGRIRLLLRQAKECNDY